MQAPTGAAADGAQAASRAPWCTGRGWPGLGLTRLEGLPACPRGLVLAARVCEVVPPHLFDNLVDLGRVPCEGNSVGDVVGCAAGKSSPVPGNVVPVHSTSGSPGRPTGGQSRSALKNELRQIRFSGK